MADEAKVAADAAAKAAADAAAGGEGGKTEPKMVPESVVIAKETERREAVKEAKEAKDALAKFQADAAAAVTKKDVKELAKDADAFKAKYPNVDPEFIDNLIEVAKGGVLKDVDQKIAPITEKEREAGIDKKFKEAFAVAIGEMPEFKDIANPEVIKALSLLPRNKDKTFNEIIEDAYGSAVPGRKTLKETKPGGGKEPQPLDFNKARKDPTYFKEVMADPKMKAQYNEEMLKRG